MKKYKKPIYYIGTQTASNLMTIRIYVEEYNERHNYDYMVCSFDYQSIVEKFNIIREEIISIYKSPGNHQVALTELEAFNPNTPLDVI